MCKTEQKDAQSTRLSRRLVGGMVASLILLLLFGQFALHYEKLGEFDRRVYQTINGWQQDVVTCLMVVVTHMGSAPVEIGLALLMLYQTRKRQRYHKVDAVMLAICLSGAWMLNEVLKSVFQRTRPEWMHLVAASGYSFPSGHAMISVAFYGFLGYILWQKRQGGPWVLAGLALATLIGISRVYLGVHYPTDVLAGFLIGGAWLISCISAGELARRFHSS